ncbi:hypothetical protein HDU86_002848 [Geranomyces michiganensis]|nr:hypothetical protein HDU86_002848 [Geranomyces michiganensis]
MSSSSHHHENLKLHLEADALAPRIVRFLAHANIAPYTSTPYPIYVIDNIETVTKLLEIVNKVSGAPPRSAIRVVGLDCETAVRNGVDSGAPSMLQIAFADELVVIFQIYRMCTINGTFNPYRLPEPLKALIESPAIIKTGVGITGDINGLKLHYGIARPASIIDTSKIVRSMGLGRMSLASLFAAYCGGGGGGGGGSEAILNKTRPSGASYMWDTGPGEIGINAVLYAANDAAASLKVYKCMFRHPFRGSGGVRTATGAAEVEVEEKAQEQGEETDAGGDGGGGHGGGGRHDNDRHDAQDASFSAYDNASASPLPRRPRVARRSSSSAQSTSSPPPWSSSSSLCGPRWHGTAAQGKSLRTMKLPSGRRHDRSAHTPFDD